LSEVQDASIFVVDHNTTLHHNPRTWMC